MLIFRLNNSFAGAIVEKKNPGKTSFQLTGLLLFEPFSFNLKFCHFCTRPSLQVDDDSHLVAIETPQKWEQCCLFYGCCGLPENQLVSLPRPRNPGNNPSHPTVSRARILKYTAASAYLNTKSVLWDDPKSPNVLKLSVCILIWHEIKMAVLYTASEQPSVCVRNVGPPVER